eukprot:gnl/MRDRNA2_/MRDRNA2_73945_c0_seq1.p1 gnl/MRDRNA2_/MRDRNA2_73945_c0~~gnl/MRDRNA2_/MRDRNA2_73945_c0_seq1.p1  ORF type:complete len:240 (+),score=76.76 gnl/MRDRNA2_/MRDRNA2_73945_c0_seq1:64-720(+)
MARFIALFALVLGANALNVEEEQAKYKSMATNVNQDVATLEQLIKANDQLSKHLATFEKRDLKDPEVYREYVAVREGAKTAAAALDAKYRATMGAPPADSKEDEDWRPAEQAAEETVQLKESVEESVEEDEVAEEQVEEKEEKQTEEVEQKQSPKPKKTKKLHLKSMTEADKEKVRNLQKKFSSPYRAASKMPEPKEVDVIDEGVGSYGKYKAQIVGA